MAGSKIKNQLSVTRDEDFWFKHDAASSTTYPFVNGEASSHPRFRHPPSRTRTMKEPVRRRKGCGRSLEGMRREDGRRRYIKRHILHHCRVTRLAKKGCDDEGMRSTDAKKCSRQEIGSAEWFFVRANRGTSLFWRSVTARDRAEDPSSESGGGERTWSRTRGKDETTGEGDRSRGGEG